jgi:hypothetical protein
MAISLVKRKRLSLWTAVESLLAAVSLGPGDDARVVQAADFGFAQAENVEQNLVGVLAQCWAPVRRQAWQPLKSSGVVGIR